MGTANIAFGHAGAFYSRDAAPIFSQAGDAENLTTTNASSTTSNISAPAGGQSGRDMAVRIVLSEEGYVRVNAAAAVGTGMRCLADVEYFFAVAPNDTVSIIDTA